MAYCRCILESCGDQLVRILSVLLNGRSACGITANISLMLNARDESRRAQEAVCASLEALRRLAKLFCVLGIQDRCAEVFRQLTTASCLLGDVTSSRRMTPEAPKKPATSLPLPFALGKQKLEKLHAAHALSLDLVLSSGLEMGSHASECWSHVFQCCAHITQLEHAYFSATSGSERKLAKAQLPNEQQSKNEVDQSALFNYDDDLM